MAVTPLDRIRTHLAHKRRTVADPTVDSSNALQTGFFPTSQVFEAEHGARGGRPRRQPFLQRIVSAWMNRLLTSVSERSLGSQEAAYAEHATGLDYIWNTVGTSIWGLVFPLLTIVATQLAGAEEAGMFSMAFVTGTLLMIACNYGVRNYQVSDVDEDTAFASYQLNRWMCAIAACAIGALYIAVRGYSNYMATICTGVYSYKIIDGIADVYEGRLQQADKLYLGGISQAVRSIGVVAVFSAVLFITDSMAAAAVGMAVVSVISFVLLTLPLALLETEKSRHVKLSEAISLFVRCLPSFAALFLFNLIESMPKFVMESALPYKNQLYFNALFFPAQGILLTIGFIYKPQLLRLSQIWSSPRQRRKFDIVVVAFVGAIVVITGLMALFMGTVGIDLLGMLYGLDFERFRTLAYLMVIAGGITAAIDFLHAVITVLRHAKDVMRVYIVCFAASVVVPLILVNLLGLTGAAASYLGVMALLLTLQVIEYVRIRKRIARARNPFGK